MCREMVVIPSTPQLRFARGAILAHLAQQPGNCRRARIKPVTKAHPEVPHHIWSAALRSLLVEAVIARTRRWPWERSIGTSGGHGVSRRRRWIYRLTPKGEHAVAEAKEYAQPRILLPGDGR